MEKGKTLAALSASLQNKLDLNHNSNNLRKGPTKNFTPTALRSFSISLDKPKPPTLVNLCLGVIGRHFEDIIDDLAEIAASFPPDIKMAMAAIARRRKLLNDDIITALIESSWEILDISSSDVSDVGLLKVVEVCTNLRAVDISRCSRITPYGVSELLQHCHRVEILRWGGCPKSDYTGRCCLDILKPKLFHVSEESWEEIDTEEIRHSAESLRWLVWQNIDDHSLESLSAECPRIVVNPKPSPFGYKGLEIPREATMDLALDATVVKDIDPKTWTLSSFRAQTPPSSISNTCELPIAEKFRLAFVERDTRLAPKRAKNARQHQRRAEREWVSTSMGAKAIALASRASKSLHGLN